MIGELQLSDRRDATKQSVCCNSVGALVGRWISVGYEGVPTQPYFGWCFHFISQFFLGLLERCSCFVGALSDKSDRSDESDESAVS